MKNDNITVRAAEPSDADLIYKWENDREIWRVSETYAPYSLFQIEQFLLSNNDLFSTRQIRLMIDTNDEKESIGCIDIYDFDPLNMRTAVGILLEKKYRKHGFAKEALQLLIDYCFNTLMLKQIYCVVDSLNTESLNLFLHVGFEQCGFRKEWIRTSDGFIDEIELQLINKNYK